MRHQMGPAPIAEYCLWSLGSSSVMLHQEGVPSRLRHHHNKEARIHGPLHETDPPAPPHPLPLHAHYPLPLMMGNIVHQNVKLPVRHIRS